MSSRILAGVLVAALVSFPTALAGQRTSDPPAGTVPEERGALTIDLADIAARSESDPRSWQEEWRLEVSRGASAPLVWADSLLLVASLDRNVHLVSAGPDPRIVWKESFKGGFEAAPVVTADRIYLPETRKGARLVVLDRSTRRIAWTASAGDLVAPPLVQGERIYAVSSIGEVRSYETGGTLRWTTELETRVVSAPVILEGSLVVASSNGVLYGLDATSGEVRDSLEAGAGPIWGDPLVRPESPATAIYATLDGQLIEVGRDLTILQRRSFPSRFYAGPTTADGDRLLLVGHEGTAWAYDWPAAEVAWRSELPGTFRASAAPGAGVLAVGDLAGTFYVLDDGTGELLWHAALDDAVTSRALARGPQIYVVTESGTLYAFRPVGAPAR